MDQNLTQRSHTIYVTYLDYLLFLTVFVDFPLTSKTGGCWNHLYSGSPRLS